MKPFVTFFGTSRDQVYPQPLQRKTRPTRDGWEPSSAIRDVESRDGSEHLRMPRRRPTTSTGLSLGSCAGPPHVETSRKSSRSIVDLFMKSVPLRYFNGRPPTRDRPSPTLSTMDGAPEARRNGTTGRCFLSRANLHCFIHAATALPLRQRDLEDLVDPRRAKPKPIPRSSLQGSSTAGNTGRAFTNVCKMFRRCPMLLLFRGQQLAWYMDGAHDSEARANLAKTVLDTARSRYVPASDAHGGEMLVEFRASRYRQCLGRMHQLWPS